jgi:hypothetical protein
MSKRYHTISAGRKVRIESGYLYVMQTNMSNGMLEQGGYADRVYRMPYAGTVISSQVPNEHGIIDIDRCVESGEVIRQGRLIR